MYYPTTRLLTILELLQTYRSMSGPELARRVEISERTVRHYITLLQDMGIPVQSERGRYGRYILRPGFKLPPMMFTQEEAVALVVALLVARKSGLIGKVADVEGALAKIERVMPNQVAERVRALQETVVFDLDELNTRMVGDEVSALSMAVYQMRRVRLCYESWGGELTEREVDIYGLACQRGRWYAAGYCHLRQDVRVFRLDRLLAFELREEHFERPAGFDVLRCVESSIATAPIGWTVEVLLETTLEEARSKVSPVMATLDEVPGGVLLRGQSYGDDDLRWMAHFLTGLGYPLMVLRPPKLRDELRRLSVRAAELANRVP